MADLVRDHVCLREVARRPEALLEVTEERQIEIDLPVGRTIEGTHRRLAEPARRLRRVGEEDQHWWLVRAATLGEDLAPRLFRVGEDHGHELRLRVVVSYARGAARA